jgi:hypothetical protein
MGSEILRFAQDDRADLAVAEELSRAFEQCLKIIIEGYLKGALL